MNRKENTWSDELFYGYFCITLSFKLELLIKSFGLNLDLRVSVGQSPKQ